MRVIAFDGEFEESAPRLMGSRCQLEGLRECCKLPPLGDRGRAPAENESGALKSCQKATGGNHFEYSEMHVLQ